MPDYEQLRKSLARRAIGMEIGGFRPTDSPSASLLGRVNLALPGESWPACGDQPMHALCQINLRELPFRPPLLDDAELVAVFIGPHTSSSGHANNDGWCLRAYCDLSLLVPLPQMGTNSQIKPLPMRPRIIEVDFPCWDDLPWELARDLSAKELSRDYFDKFENVNGFKLGGWPTLIQSEIFWAPWNKHPADPEYVFQIDSTEKGNLYWGDNGVAYFGRGTRPGHTDEWFFEGQCY